MQWIKHALAVPLIMASAACGTLDRFRPPTIVVQAPAPVVPVECRVQPLERRQVPQPTLSPEVGSPAEVAANQLSNAQVAFAYWWERATVAEEQADTNAGPQGVCATWAVQQ